MTISIQAARRGRWAMTAMFLANGFIIGSWAPQIPLLMTRLEISETLLGVLILLFGIGALVAMPSSGILMARLGSRAVLQGFALLACFGLLVVVAVPTFWLVVPAMIFFGGVVGGMDVAMNTNAVSVEQHMGRGIMSSSHGFWSLGGFFGGGIGGLVIQTQGYFVHAVIVTALSLAIVAVAQKFLVEDPAHRASANKPAAKFEWPRNPTVYVIGLIALFCMIPEGAILDWAAIYLKQELDADIAVAGLAFAAFSGTMATMRFLGDHVRHRFGAVRTLRVSSIVAAAGMLLAGLASDPLTAIAAFAFAGLGVANIVPIAFSAAGNQSGISTSAGMSVVTTMGYSGILVAPSVVGFIGERTGFSPVFIAMSFLLVAVFLLGGLVRTADFRHR